jgi:class I lanthipeptide synthase
VNGQRAPTGAPATRTELARRLRADARAGILAGTDPGLHLDLAVAELAFAAALAEPSAAPDALDRALELLGDRRPTPWLFRGGAAHFGWVSAQVAAASAAPAAPPEASRSPRPSWPDLSRWDDVVDAALRDFPADRDVDLPLGLLGLGVYALAHPVPAVRERLVGRVLDVIEGRAEHDVDGLLVRLVDAPHRRAEGSAGLVVLGPAHGMSGVVSFLGSVAGAGLACSARTHPLLSGCVRWLLRQRVAADGGGSDWVRTGHEPHRLSWCYGDPGIALALGVAAAATGSTAIERTTEEITAGVLARAPDEAGVLDATICHGAAGLAWFGSRVAGRTDHPAAHRMARYWTDRIAELRAAGPLRYGPDGVRDHSFLEGDLGVALAVLTAATGCRAAWEQLLLGAPAGLARAR